MRCDSVTPSQECGLQGPCVGRDVTRIPLSISTWNCGLTPHGETSFVQTFINLA